MKTCRNHSHAGPFRSAFLALLLIACASGTAKTSGCGKTLFLLTGTCHLNGTSATFPARLYTVTTQRKLMLFRTVVSGSEGTTNILDDMHGNIYVTFPSDLGAHGRAPTKVSIIHKQCPGEDDLVTFNPDVMLDEPYSEATAAGPGHSSYALFVLFPEPPPTVNSHATFMRYLRSSAATLVAVAGNPPAKGARITRNDWTLYRHLTFAGSPGGPGYYPPPEVTVENRGLVMRYGGKTVLVDQAPLALPASANGHEIRIVAANRQFVVTWLFRTSDRSAPATLYVHDRQLGRWSEIKLPWSLPQSRIFGPWLAAIAMSDEGGGGMWRDLNPGHKDERDRWVRDLLPNVSQEFDTRGYTLIPGVLVLYNLVDGRRITLRTNEEDSEILDVRKDGLVLYRVNNEIFSAQIEGDKLGPAKLVVKGQDVPEVHWIFWSKARTEPHALAEGAPHQQGSFTLALAAPRQPLKTGQPLLLHMTTTNTSDHALSNVPMTQGSADVAKIYQVHVLNGEGHPGPPRVPPPPPKGKTVIRMGMGHGVSGLQPGRSVTDQVNVTALYDLSRPGKYRIWIAEQFGRGPHGPVRSNTITVTVVK